MAVNQARKMTPMDESVYFQVRIALKVNPPTEGIYKEIKIDANRGVVTLQGSVPSEEIAPAERAAGQVAEVVKVINELKVS